MDQPVLSFCVSTLNRCAHVMNLINSILDCAEKDIELIVINNGSEDDTEAKLRSIADPRFKYYQHKVNIGPISTIHALFKATGKYAVLISDEEMIVARNLPSILQFLRNTTELSVVLPSVETYNRGQNRYDRVLSLSYHSNIYRRGADALKYMSFFHVYLSGIIVHTKLLKENFSIEDIQNHGGRVGHIYYKDKLLLKKDAATLATTLIRTNNYSQKIFSDTEAFINESGACCLHPRQRLGEIFDPMFKLIMHFKSACLMDDDTLMCLYVRLYFNALLEIMTAMSESHEMEKIYGAYGYSEECFDEAQIHAIILRRFFEDSTINDSSTVMNFILHLSGILKHYLEPAFDALLMNFFNVFCTDDVRVYMIYMLNENSDLFPSILRVCAKSYKNAGLLDVAEALLHKGLGYCLEARGVFNAGYSQSITQFYISFCYNIAEVYYLKQDYSAARRFFTLSVTLSHTEHKAAIAYLDRMEKE